VPRCAGLGSSGALRGSADPLRGSKALPPICISLRRTARITRPGAPSLAAPQESSITSNEVDRL
jgi:hypothetical protein